MITNSFDAEKSAVKHVAELMVAAARTAPKADGIDKLDFMIVDGEEKDKLTQEMRRICYDKKIDFIGRDAGNIDSAYIVILFGTKKGPIGNPNCGYCGYEDCAENIKNDGICAFNTGDLGIAIDSAVSVAANHFLYVNVVLAALFLAFFNRV